MMRRLLAFSTIVLLAIPSALPAQPAPLVDFNKIHVGFRPYKKEAFDGNFKAGLWTPVYVDITAGPKGLEDKCKIRVETADSEGVGAIYEIPIQVPPNEGRVFTAYIKPGQINNEVQVTVFKNDSPIKNTTHHCNAMDIHLGQCLTINGRLQDWQDALKLLNDKMEMKMLGQGFRQGGRDEFDLHGLPRLSHEPSMERLPEQWYGYEGVDLVVLLTKNTKFLVELQQKRNADRLRALAQWVRRGGRLLVPVSPDAQDVVHQIFSAPEWTPAVPAVPPAHDPLSALTVNRLSEVESWGGVNNRALENPDRKPIRIATLDSGKVGAGDWEVLARTSDQRPLIAKVRYGLGQIIFFAFSLEDPPVSSWEGRFEFLQRSLEQLAPKSKNIANENVNMGWRAQGMQSNDLMTSMLREMDKFDVQVIPFHYVALFILLYIIIVGPIDFIVLKYVLKRMELTWITFPLVVFTVSGLAYFAAFAIKGQEMKINKLDLIDIDLRTELNEAKHSAKPWLHGQTFFTILSPRIQSYNIGIEANPAFWGGSTNNLISADMVTWAGRPDDQAFGMNRSGSQGLFRRPYHYSADAAGLLNVPIPVWTSKAFTATWETTTPRPPLEIDLRYSTREGNPKLTGKITSRFAENLTDVWVIYSDRVFEVKEIQAMKDGKAETMEVTLDGGSEFKTTWLNSVRGVEERPKTTTGPYDPLNNFKRILFHERFDPAASVGNHTLKSLDLGWRIRVERGGAFDRATREAILVGRVAVKEGDAETVNAGPQPTSLWLGQLPEKGKSRPQLSGQMIQDTFVRVILPVLPAER